MVNDVQHFFTLVLPSQFFSLDATRMKFARMFVSLAKRMRIKAKRKTNPDTWDEERQNSLASNQEEEMLRRKKMSE